MSRQRRTVPRGLREVCARDAYTRSRFVEILSVMDWRTVTIPIFFTSDGRLEPMFCVSQTPCGWTPDVATGMLVPV